MKKIQQIPTERLVAALTGPLSALVALGATALVHSTISQATAVNAATFILTGLATLAGHIAWLNNLPKWWEKQSSLKITAGNLLVDGVTPEKILALMGNDLPELKGLIPAETNLAKSTTPTSGQVPMTLAGSKGLQSALKPDGDALEPVTLPKPAPVSELPAQNMVSPA
jgi:hypothetical protein